MKVAVIQFPGSNCDWDVYHALTDSLNVPTKMLWHKETSLREADAIVLPGGFSYGDYLRCGAIARFSPIMPEIINFAKRGGRVLGICNGFQILCETGLLPGCLIRNTCLEFRCHNQDLAVENSTQWFSRSFLGEHIRVPVAHGEGNYRIEGGTLDELEAHKQVLFRYSGEKGNPNGSMNQIAGIRNRAGNIFGMMPHPERAVESFHPSQEGIPILNAFLKSEVI